MCQIVQDVGIIRFYFCLQKYFGTINFCRCHRMSENSDVGLHKLNCIYKDKSREKKMRKKKLVYGIHYMYKNMDLTQHICTLPVSYSILTPMVY